MEQFGVIRDKDGKLLNPTINIEGVEVAKATLADWIWQGCSYMKEEYNLDASSVRSQFLKSTITEALTIHNKLLECSDEEIQEHIDNYFSVSDEQVEPIEEVTLKAYFDYYGKDAPIPSSNSTEVTPRYIRLYNSSGLLATYNRKTGEFTPKYE